MRIRAVEEADLRKVTHHFRFLEGVSRKYHLTQEGDAVVYNGKSKDRYRLVIRLGGRPMLVMPEVDMDHRVSRYLRVSIRLRKLAKGEAAERLKEFVSHAEARLARAEQRFLKAMQVKIMRGMSNG